MSSVSVLKSILFFYLPQARMLAVARKFLFPDTEIVENIM